MILKILRLLFALALAVCAYHAHPQDSLESTEPESEVEAEDARQFPTVATPTPTEKSAELREHLVRSEAARSRGDIQTQVAELRRAHALAQGRDSNLVNLLADALILKGDRNGARRLRENILATDLRPGDKLAHAITLAVDAADDGDFATANKWMAISESIARQFGDGDNPLLAQTGLHWARSALLLAQGKYRESEAEGRLAAAAVRKLIDGAGGKTVAQTRYWQNRIDAKFARALVRQGKLAESEWHFRDALERSTREAGANSVHTARFALELANVQLRQGRYEDALGQALAARTTLEQRKIRKSANMVYALHLIGWSQVMAGRFEPAVAAFEERAQKARGDGGSVVWGYAMIRTGRAQAALPMLRAHYEASMRRSPKSYPTRERAAMYAYALLRAGQAAEASSLFAASLPGLLRSRQTRRIADRADVLTETVSNWIIEGYLESLSREAESDGARAIAEMFRLADVARGSSVQRALALASTRARIADHELAGMVRQEQDLGNRQSALGRILEGLLARARERQSQKVIAGIRRDIEVAAEERDILRREIAARFPKYSQLIEPRPTTTAELRKLLKPGEVMLSTYSVHDRTYVWAVPAAGAIRFAVSALGASAIDSAVKNLRLALDVGNVSLAAFPAYDTASAFSLYEELLKPVESAWSKADALIVVAHGALGQLPFALLPSAAVNNAHSVNFEGYRKVPWLIRKLAISQLPSVSTLAMLRFRPARVAAAASAFTGFGDPRFRAESPSEPGTLREWSLRNLRVATGGDQARPASLSDFGRLPPLPDTAQEIREIAAILKAGSGDVLLGLQASETNVKQRKLDQYRVLMFATHGLVPGDLDGLTQPALALSNPQITGETDSDGLLTLDEILGLKLAADWVVLSACNTAAGHGAGGEAVSGLGRAFFYAGARALLVSNWPVETVSARLITTDLFRRQSENPSLTRGEALRQTLLNLIDRGEAKDASGQTRFAYAHPMFWAPFSLVGDAGQVALAPAATR